MSQQKKSPALNIVLWIIQVLVGVMFIATGIMKLVTPIPTLAAMWSWAGEFPSLVRFTGVIDFLGGVGLIFPALTRIKPNWTVLAALGCALLQISAIAFHLSRGEGANTPFNFVLLALMIFVFWGRRTRAVIEG